MHLRSLAAAAGRAGQALRGLLAATALLLALAGTAGAATRDVHFAPLGAERGLSQNTITALVQDRRGFMWVGTQGGLHRYDGQRYAVLRHDPRDPASLPDSYVTALALDGADGLWVGSLGAYVARLDLRNGAVRRYRALPGSGRDVRALLPVPGGVLVATSTGLHRLDTETGAQRRMRAHPPAWLRTAPRQSLLQDGDDVLYGNVVGLVRVGPDGSARAITAPGPVHAMHRDASGTVWVSSAQVVHRLVGDRLEPAWSDPERIGRVVAIARAPDGRLWMAGDATGLARWDPRDGSTVVMRDDRGRQPGVPEPGVNVLLVDASGLLWAGGRLRGVMVADPAGTRFARLLDVDGQPLEDSLRAIHEAPDGALWVATDNGRLVRATSTTTADYGEVLASLPPPLRRVTAIAGDGPGRLWLATLGGLFRLEIAARRAVQVPTGDALHLRSMLRAGDGTLWLGTAGGGVVRRAPDGTLRTWPLGSDGDDAPATVHALWQDARGRIWAGTGAGLYRIDPLRGTHQRVDTAHGADGLRSTLVRALHPGSGGPWVGTHAGLSRAIERSDGSVRFEHPLEAGVDGRPEPVVFTIASARDGALWLGTDAGLMRFDPRTRAVRTFGMADGLQAREFNGNAVAALRDGRLAFGGVAGLNIFDPARIGESRFAPPVRLLAAHIGARTPVLEPVLWDDRALRLPGEADLLRLRIGALDFAPGERMRYRYRLEGFDPGWIDNGNRADITYTRLPPGRYTFVAQGTNRDGVWSPATLSVPIHVAPPWWRHPATKAAAGLALAALVAWVVLRRRRSRRIRAEYDRRLHEHDERLKLALWASGDQFWDFDIATGRVRRMDVLEPVHEGATPGIEVHTRDAPEHTIHPDDLPQVIENLRAHVRGEAPMLLSEHRVRDQSLAPDGSWVWVRARGRVVERDAAGRAVRVAGTARDITASRIAERERLVSGEVLRSMAEAVAVFDREFRFVAVNPAFTAMTGYAEHEVLGRPTSMLDGHVHAPTFYDALRTQLRDHGRYAGEVWQRRRDGAEFLCWLQASAIEDAHGAPGLYVAVLGDITEQKRAEQELRYLANYDALTSLPNRTLLSARLSEAIARARRDGTRLAVLFLDLDRFKDINDTLGHAAGDRLLCAAGKRLQQAVGVQHTVARLGGDEFTVVLERLATPADAQAVAEQVLAAFAAPLDFADGPEMVVSPSIGIALFPDHADTPADLLKHADTAMYHAKAAGRRTWSRYDASMDVEIRRRATISAALRKVLERNEFELVFQPQVSLDDDRVTGVEALLRWTRGEHGVIEPAQFIPLAEETGLILEIGEWVLRRASEQLGAWRAAGFADLAIAVNVSALQLLRGELPDTIARILADTGVPADRLELELTESMLMANAGRAASTLDALQRMGVRMAIDDFGTGYSSLAYLRRLPIHTVKIDKAFVDGTGEDGEDRAITAAIIAMAHSLGLNVVAEGVETDTQLAFLRGQGCDEAQGYRLARPMDAAACLEFLRRWPGRAAAQGEG